LSNNVTGSGNTASGTTAAEHDRQQQHRLGANALLNDTGGNNNTATANSALQSNLTGTQNTAVGVNALANATGDNNTAFGYQAGNSLTSDSKQR